jgi:hypothetical protein
MCPADLHFQQPYDVETFKTGPASSQENDHSIPMFWENQPTKLKHSQCLPGWRMPFELSAGIHIDFDVLTSTIKTPV